MPAACRAGHTATTSVRLRFVAPLPTLVAIMGIPVEGRRREHLRDDPLKRGINHEGILGVLSWIVK